ncbi:MAG TPA: PQQ-binding-like beta-propeller repeat protein [Ktedonosporobacter sp.]|jgi:outer membrane protein assembly factor BamB|nr:PQQ-binding-like beta-propeller repeat protein [Ktedonosporobacter sp.]
MIKQRFLWFPQKASIPHLLGTVGKAILLMGALLVQAGWFSSASADTSPFAGAAGDITTYMGSNIRINYNSFETILNRGNISQLKLHWQYHSGGTIDTQPIVSNGVIYWGSWDGYEHATNLNGQQLWQTFLGKDTPPGKCIPASAGVAGTSTVATVAINGRNTRVVFVPGGNARFYALNASNGAVIWATTLGTPPDEMIWAGSALYKGSIYVGISSYGDCPLRPGRVYRLSSTTGAILNTFHTTSNNCNGAGVWDAPAVDVASNTIFVSTGTRTLCGQYESLAYAVLQLRASDLTLVRSWQVPLAQQAYDSDFGDSPTLFTARIGGTIHPMLGILNKNGHYYAFDRSNIGAGPVWERQLAGPISNIAASAWDGTKLYVATAVSTVAGKRCAGTVWALNPATGQTAWEYCTPGKVVAAPTVIPGLVIISASNQMIILDTATGQPKFIFRAPGFGATFFGSATVSHGVLYIGNANGTLYAFGL